MEKQHRNQDNAFESSFHPKRPEKNPGYLVHQGISFLIFVAVSFVSGVLPRFN